MYHLASGHYEQAKHANESKCTWGIDGTTGVMADMKDLGIWEPYSVKTQTYKTAVEVRSCRSPIFSSSNRITVVLVLVVVAFEVILSVLLIEVHRVNDADDAAWRGHFHISSPV